MFNLHSVVCHVLERDGATFRATEEPFLESSRPNFHPTDVLEDADGSFLVIDTGAWFRHCPTSQIDQREVPGGIYRIRRTAASPVADPYGRKIAWKAQNSRALARLLADPRFAVRDRAATLLVHQGDPALPALWGLLRHHSRQVRTQIVWVLARMASDGARAAIRQAMRDRDTCVRLAAVTAAGLNRDSRAFDRLRELVGSGTPPVRREAATALGRLDRTEAVPALLKALRNDPDRFLEHALIFAMIRLGDRRATQAGLDDPDPSVRRGCLIALDQMSRGRLTLDLGKADASTPP